MLSLSRPGTLKICVNNLCFDECLPDKHDESRKGFILGEGKRGEVGKRRDFQRTDDAVRFQSDQ